MSSAAGYLRFPSICADQVVFVTEDDLWSVDARGGVARRLTSDLVEIGRPALSPDGKLVAFTSKAQGQPDVHVMPASGGPAGRLTWLGQASVLGWAPDGRIVLASAAGQPFSFVAHAYYLSFTPVAGGGLEAVGFGPVSAVAFGPDGEVVIGRNTADPARWKRYRGGTAGALWVDPDGSGSWRTLLSAATLGEGAPSDAFPGNLACPMWVGGRIWFLSDHEGIGNLYSVNPDGTGLYRHSDHAEHYARWAATDGRRIVYQVAAELWLHDPAGNTNQLIEVELHSPRTQRQARFVHAERYLGDAEADHKGDHLVLDVRGKLVSMPTWERAVRQHGEAQGVRYRLSRFLGSTDAVVTVSDQPGEEVIEVHSLGPAAPAAGDTSSVRRLDAGDIGRVIELAPSPDGRRVALTNHRNQVFLVEIAGGESRVVDESRFGRPSGPVWSPDSRWLAYAFPASERTSLIRVADIGGEPGPAQPEPGGESAPIALHDVTPAEFRDSSPAWDPEGRWLCFLSHRSFDPVYDAVVFDLGFPRAVRPYLVTLRAADPSPFVVRPEGAGEGASTEEGGHGGEAEPSSIPPAEPVRVDLDGIAERAVAFPVPEGRYDALVMVKGKALWLSYPVEGALARDILATTPPPGGSIECYDLAEAKLEPLVDGVSDFGLSGDRSKLVYLAHDAAGLRLRVVAAGSKPPEDHDDSPGRTSGWVDLTRVRIAVDPGAEWAQMLREAWRLQREHFWVADMSGVDWARVLERYLPLVDRVATRAEFSDLMWEMQGELGTSHAYELGGDYRPSPDWGLGRLGASIAWDASTSRWRVSKVATGASWDPREASPLRAPGVNVGVGAAIVEVNGQPVTPEWGPAQLLTNQAGQPVELTVEELGNPGEAEGEATVDPAGEAEGDPGPAGEPDPAGTATAGRRRVLVVTLTDERPLHYREWVSANRSRVREETGGRAGYLHIPDMGPVGFAEFHRNFGPEVERGCLVVDARFNRGGHVSALLLEKLARRRIGWDVSRWGPMEPYPAESVGGPMVLLTNEHAGSDGDIFTHGFKLLGLGPVVGTRTWGGVIGISPSHALVDGSLTTQPEYAFWFADVGWGVENHGADPDFEVVIRPQDHAAGRDPQLERAIALVLDALDSHRPALPDIEGRPRLTLPTLPPRSAPSSRSE